MPEAGRGAGDQEGGSEQSVCEREIGDGASKNTNELDGLHFFPFNKILVVFLLPEVRGAWMRCEW